MAQIQNLTINVGELENRRLDTSLRLPGQPPAPDVPCHKVTLNFVMNFSPGEIGLTYRLGAILYANDRQEDDSDESSFVFLPLSENGGLTELANLTASAPNHILFPRSFQTIEVTATSMPQEISRYVLADTLNEDPAVDTTGRPPFRLTPHKDELLARVSLSQVAEVKSVPEPL